MSNSAHEEFETRLAELSVSREAVEELANQLLWRIGRTEEGAHVTVRVGLASSAAMFQVLPRLRSATDAELEEAVRDGTVRLEWVGPRLPGMGGSGNPAVAADRLDGRRRSRRDDRGDGAGAGADDTERRSARRRVVRSDRVTGGPTDAGEKAESGGGRSRSRSRRSGRSSRKVGGRAVQSPADGDAPATGPDGLRRDGATGANAANAATGPDRAGEPGREPAEE